MGRLQIEKQRHPSLTNCWPIILAVLLLAVSPDRAVAETRLYHLRVTLRSGERYETISSYDPVNYCHLNGGSVWYTRGRFIIYSPQMKVKVLRTWIEPGPDLAGDWRNVLRSNNMLAFRNHKRLPRTEPLTFEDLTRPE
jgi:hypothetical protein